MAGNVIEVVIRARDEATRTIQGLQQNLARFSETKLPGANIAGGLAQSIEKIGPSTLVAAAGITAVAVAAAAATKQLIEVSDAGGRYADMLGDIAQRTGLTTEEISKLKYAAEQSDTSIEAVTGSIRFLARNLYEAREAGSEAQKAFLEIGYSQAELASGSVDAQQALLRMADAIKDAPTQLDRMAIATKFLGRGAVDLIPFLAQGSQGIRQLTADASQFGQVVTTSASDVGDRYTKAVLALNGAMNALKAQIAEGVLPAITDFLTLVTRSIAGTEELARRILSLGGAIKTLDAADPGAFFRNMKQSIETLFPFLLFVEATLKKIAEFAPKTPTPANPAVQSVNLPTATSNPLAPVQGQNTEPSLKAGGLIDQLGQIANAQKKAQDESQKAADEQAKAYAKLLATFEKVRAASFSVSDAIVASLRAAIPSIADVTKAIEAMQKVINETPTEIGKQPLKRLPVDAEGKPIGSARSLKQDVVKELPDLGGPLDEIKPKIDEAVASGSLLAQMFETIGINVEALNERLAITGESLSSIGVLGETVAASISTAFGAAFDPFATAIDGVFDAVGRLRQTFDQAFQSLGNAIIAGNTGFLKMRNFIDGVGEAMKRLLVELTLTIVKALILRAIMTAIGLAGGGTVTRGVDSGTGGGGLFASKGGTLSGVAHFLSGGQVARGAAMATMIGLAAGGAIPASARPLNSPPAIVRLVSGGAISAAPIIRLAAGGAISNVVRLASGGAITNNVTTYGGHTTTYGGHDFSNVVHAAGGVRLVPGFPQSYDSVPAMLAPGEVVLPNVGGQSPSNLLGDLSGLKKQLEQIVGTHAQQSTVSAPMIGELHVHATDADSVRNQVRPGGAIDRELARRDELGRETW